MDTLPSIATTPFTQHKEGTAATDRALQGSLNHYRTKAQTERTYETTHVDTKLAKDKNDFSYQMYMLNRKFRRVQKDAVDHFGQLHSKGKRSKGQGNNPGAVGGAYGEPRSDPREIQPILRPGVSDYGGNRRNSDSDASSVF